MSEPGKKYVSYTLGMSALTAAIFAVVSACTGGQATAKPNLVTKPAPQPGVVAKIGGETITEEQLIGDDKMDFFELKKREYDLRMNRLNQLMVEKLLGGDAKKAGMSLDDYIQKKVIKGEIKISDSDVKKFAAEKKIPDAQMNDQLKGRIREYMQNEKRQKVIQAEVASRTRSNPVEVYFEKPKMDVKVELADHTPILGKKSAKVKIGRAHV